MTLWVSCPFPGLSAEAGVGSVTWVPAPPQREDGGGRNVQSREAGLGGHLHVCLPQWLSTSLCVECLLALTYSLRQSSQVCD